MVKIVEPRLSVGGKTFNPFVPGALVTPTALGGLKIVTGSESCSDHPAPGTMTFQIVIPSGYADWEPVLNQRVTLGAIATDAASATFLQVNLFEGVLDTVQVTKARTGTAAPSLLANGEGMTSLAGFEFLDVTTSSTGEPITGVTFAPGGSSITIPTQPAGEAKRIRVKFPKTKAAVPGSLALSLSFGLSRVSPPTERRLTAPSLSAHYLELSGPDGASLGTVNPSAVGYRNDGLNPSAAGGVEFTSQRTAAYARPVIEFTLSRDFIGTSVNLRFPRLLAVSDARAYPGEVWTVTASDLLAPASRFRVGDKPWSTEDAGTRVGRIGALSAPLGFGFLAPPDTYTVGPRDVDSKSPLELHQRTVAAAGVVSVARPADFASVIGTSAPMRQPYALTLAADKAVLVPDQKRVTTLPASAIERVPMVCSVANMANQIKVTYRTEADKDNPFGSDATTSAQDPASVLANGPMARTINTDALGGETVPPDAPLMRKLPRLLAGQAKPRFELAGGARVLLSELEDSAAAVNLMDIYSNFGTLVRLTNAPARLDQFQRIKSFELTLGAEPALTLGLESSDYSGTTSITSRECAAGTTSRNIKIKHLTAITSRDLERANADD